MRRRFPSFIDIIWLALVVGAGLVTSELVGADNRTAGFFGGIATAALIVVGLSRLASSKEPVLPACGSREPGTHELTATRAATGELWFVCTCGRRYVLEHSRSFKQVLEDGTRSPFMKRAAPRKAWVEDV